MIGTTIYSRDKSEKGKITAILSPYRGEAGFSNRVEVTWPGGKKTRCCVKGMKPFRRGLLIL